MSKTHIKMGMHNRITIDRFQAIKDDVIAGLPVNKVAKRNNVSESTVRKFVGAKTSTNTVFVLTSKSEIATR